MHKPTILESPLYQHHTYLPTMIRGLTGGQGMHRLRRPQSASEDACQQSQHAGAHIRASRLHHTCWLEHESACESLRGVTQRLAPKALEAPIANGSATTPGELSVKREEEEGPSSGPIRPHPHPSAPQELPRATQEQPKRPPRGPKRQPRGTKRLPRTAKMTESAWNHRFPFTANQVWGGRGLGDFGLLVGLFGSLFSLSVPFIPSRALILDVFGANTVFARLHLAIVFLSVFFNFFMFFARAIPHLAIVLGGFLSKLSFSYFSWISFKTPSERSKMAQDGAPENPENRLSLCT